MRTLILAVLLLPLWVDAQKTLTEDEIEKARMAYNRGKYEWPDSLLEAELPDLPGELWEKRDFVYALSCNEAAGKVKMVRHNPRHPKKDAFGCAQIIQITVNDYYRITHEPPRYKAEDMAHPEQFSDSVEQYFVTRVLPLRIMNTITKHYGLTAFWQIAKRWNYGSAWRRAPDTYWNNVQFYLSIFDGFYREGYAAYCNPPDPE